LLRRSNSALSILPFQWDKAVETFEALVKLKPMMPLP
jgi:hypothetical protein